ARSMAARASSSALVGRPAAVASAISAPSSRTSMVRSVTSPPDSATACCTAATRASVSPRVLEGNPTPPLPATTFSAPAALGAAGPTRGGGVGDRGAQFAHLGGAVGDLTAGFCHGLLHCCHEGVGESAGAGGESDSPADGDDLQRAGGAGCFTHHRSPFAARV